MSRYMINKLLVEIDLTDESVERYIADHRAFVALWEAAYADPNPPHPWGGMLTAGEREAFAAFDYETLYRLGAHPFLLWHVVRAVLVTDDTDVAAVSSEYVERVRPHGYPDFTT